jgi:signal peptidase I
MIKKLKPESYGGFTIDFYEEHQRINARIRGINHFVAIGNTKEEAFNIIKQNINNNRIKGIKRRLLKAGDIIHVDNSQQYTINRFGVLYIKENNEWTPYSFSKHRENNMDNNALERRITSLLENKAIKKGFIRRSNQSDYEFYTSQENYGTIKKRRGLLT